MTSWHISVLNEHLFAKKYVVFVDLYKKTFIFAK